MSKEIMDRVESNSTVPVKALQDQLQKKYGVDFSIHKVFRAKVDVKKNTVGDYKKHYKVLRAYILEFQSANPDTTVKLELEDVLEPTMLNYTSRCFKILYVYLEGMKNSFKACLIDLLGLDGDHIKGPYPSQILTTVGLDYNNVIHPLAYAIIETENCQRRKWFLECLGDDLNLNVMSNFTFVSDIQKLRTCSHVLNIGIKEYKDHLWDRATVTTLPDFNHYIHQLSLYCNSACKWLKSIPPQHWAKSYFTAKLFILTNCILS
uniref:MULE transposase domain-containing protein n=1 Tax=Lactuca sativa TaxID=4236 RepID=A0A9R1VUT6_LACSA|nr:hypothetical protein LSAT_V11C400221980 [Lactuca sativa]